MFRDVNGSFTAVADFVSNSSGAPGDMFMNWMTQLQQTNPNLTFSTVTVIYPHNHRRAAADCLHCLRAGHHHLLLLLLTLYGTVLYVTGPLVLALIPVSGSDSRENLRHQSDDLERLGHSLFRVRCA